MSDDDIRQAVGDAIEAVKNEEPMLRFASVHERTTAHRLALHMETHFLGWNVDCEYDRDGRSRKALQGIAGCRPDKKGDDILPDIIVHHREGTGPDHNLLVVELKKDNQEDLCDKQKLENLTSPNRRYRYQLGLYINIDNGNFGCTWYKNGSKR